MGIKRIKYDYYSPDEFEYECDICGKSVEEDDVTMIKEDVYCPHCLKSYEEEQEELEQEERESAKFNRNKEEDK